MSIFSKLSGTLQNKFTIGKKGIKLVNQNNELQIRNNTDTIFIPIGVGEPTKLEHAITLSYFNSHGSGTGGTILSGTEIPDDSLGVDGNVYFRIDDTSIIGIYFKDSGIWKEYLQQSTKSAFSKLIDKASWSVDGSNFSIIIDSTEHDQDGELIISTYQNLVDSDISTSPFVLNQPEITILQNNSIKILSSAKFSGKIIISGR